jgi:Alr-MurF fusion protein
LTLSIRNIISILKAHFEGINDIAIIDSISIDSRSLQNNETTLFFALVGPNHDGHNYINELIEKGVSNFVVHHIPDGLETKANYLIVNDSLVASNGGHCLSS